MNPIGLANAAYNLWQKLPGGKPSNNFGIKDRGVTEAIGSVLGTSTNTQNKSPQNYPPKPDPVNYPVNSSNNYIPSGTSPNNNTYQHPSMDPILEEINRSYDESYKYLDQAEKSLRGQLPSALEQAEKEYALSQGNITNQKAQADQRLNLQGEQAYSRKEEALAAARRLANEQRMGGNQRFGGSSSAGQAYSEIIGTEQQRQMGQTQRDFGSFMRDVDLKRTEIESNYIQGVKELEVQKNMTLTQIHSDFQNKLLQIASNRAQIGQAKSQMRLQALQDFRNQIFQIELQTREFQAALEQQKQSSLSGISQYANLVADSHNYVDNAYNSTVGGDSFSTNRTSNFSLGGNNSGVSSNPYVGQIATNTRRPEDDLFSSVLG